MGDGVCVNGTGSVPPIRSGNKILVGARITGPNLEGYFAIEDYHQTGLLLHLS